MGNLFAFIETMPEEGRAKYESAQGEFYLDAKPNGFYGNDIHKAAFERNGRRGTFWMGNRSFPCESVVAGAAMNQPPRVHGQSQALNAVGRSYGGKLRDGPGTNFRQIGSIAEGTWLTIVANTGVQFDGYDWFEVALDNGTRGYQWGGILCNNGPVLSGIFRSCQESQASYQPPAASAPAQGGRGWMAFAIGSNGKFGHGAGSSRAEAERYALQYCGQPGCRVEDVTQARCHALATVPGGFWFGTAENEAAAQSFAMGFCSNASGGGCRIDYTYCQ